MKKIIPILIVFISVYSCNVTRMANVKDKINPFFAYNFGGLEKKPPQEQINVLKDAGYDGISLRMAKKEHVEQLKEFVDLADKTDNFKIYSVFVRYNFDQSQEDRERWKEVVDLIQNKEIDLWFIFGKKETDVNDEQVEGILRNVVTYAASKKVPVTLYPHSWCYFYTAEQSLPMVKKINHPNLKLAIHTCHELKAGNSDRMDEVVENVKEYLSFVTVAGAAKEVDMSTHRTMDKTTIQPLEDGVYDYATFFTALKKINYRGPVGYINFGFEKEPEDYLPKSLEEWEKLKNQYLNY